MQFILLGAFGGCALIFIGITAAAAILTWNGWFSILPVIATSVSTKGRWSNKDLYTWGKEVLAVERTKTEGIAVDVKTVQEMKQMSDYLNLDFEKYFGYITFDDDSYHSIY